MDHSEVFSFTNPTSFLAIEDKRFPLILGGTRMISGVTKEEVTQLAKSMALKLHYFNLPIGGAKAGISSDNIQDLSTFLNQDIIRNLITGDKKTGRRFISGPDIGTSEETYAEALIQIGLKELVRPGLLANVSKLYGKQLDNIVTAMGCIACIESIVQENDELKSLKQVRISIEGFGKVGTGIAAILKNESLIVGVSTRYGSIFNEQGFDFVELLGKQQKFGDKFIYEMNCDIQSTEALFGFPADIIIPGARTEVITPEIASKIIKLSHPKAIVPTANYPYTHEGRKLLEESNILCFPDFVSSSGAVIAAMTEFSGVGTEENAIQLVRKTIKTEVRSLFAKLADSPSSSIYDIAKQISQYNKNMILKLNQDNSKDVNIEIIATEFVKLYYSDLLKD